MSAFVVEPKTINKVLTILSRYNKKGEWLGIKIQEILNSIEWDLIDPQSIGQAMFNLNLRAVDQRYSEEPDNNGYIFIPEIHETPISALKALHCWHYQCCEGDVPKTKLYKAFEKIASLLEHEIVTDLVEYDKAYWG
jgi:hypothetical protein